MTDIYDMKIHEVMTPCPYSIAAMSSLEDALEAMAIRGIRHLPVIEDGTVIGVVTERDLKLSQYVCQTTSYCPLVKDMCLKEPLIVDEDADIAEVSSAMAGRKADVALVADTEGNFVGIFTTTDACRLIHMMIEEQRLAKS